MWDAQRRSSSQSDNATAMAACGTARGVKRCELQPAMLLGVGAAWRVCLCFEFSIARAAEVCSAAPVDLALNMRATTVVIKVFTTGFLDMLQPLACGILRDACTGAMPCTAMPSSPPCCSSSGGAHSMT